MRRSSSTSAGLRSRRSARPRAVWSRLPWPRLRKSCFRAIKVAFPNGVPATDEQKSALTKWSEKQLELLSTAAGEFEDFNGRITNVLAASIARTSPRPDTPEFRSDRSSGDDGRITNLTPN